MWRIYLSKDREPPAVSTFDLQAEVGVREISASQLLPGADPGVNAVAIELAQEHLTELDALLKGAADK